MFSGCTVPPDSKETELGSSNQEASPSASKNTGVVLVPCSCMEVHPYSYFQWHGYFWGPWVSFVNTFTVDDELTRHAILHFKLLLTIWHPSCVCRIKFHSCTQNVKFFFVAFLSHLVWQTTVTGFKYHYKEYLLWKFYNELSHHQQSEWEDPFWLLCDELTRHGFFLSKLIKSNVF